MKKHQISLLSLCLTFLCFVNSSVFSQESQNYSPLLCSDTIAVAHLNLKNFDFDRFVQGQVNQVDTFFQKLNYANESREAVCREAKTIISCKVDLVKPLYQVFIAGTKIEEIVVVSYSSGLKIAPAVVATSLQGKTPNQIALLESLFKDLPLKPFQHEGFLLLPISYSPDQAEEAAEWVKNHLSNNCAEMPVLNEAFQGMTDDVILRGVVIKPDNIQELLKSIDMTELPPQALIIIDAFLEKIQWVSFGVNPYGPGAGLTIQTAGEDEAKEFWDILKSAQDAGIEGFRIGLLAAAMQGASENPGLLFFTEYIPLLTEIVRGAARQALPRIDGQKLIFSINQ